MKDKVNTWIQRPVYNLYHDDDGGGDDDDDLDAIVEIAALLGVVLLQLGLTPVPSPETKHLQMAE